MKTIVPFGDPKAQKKWSGSLFIDTVKKSYFERKFTSESDNAVIQRLTELDSGPGDTISYDLSVQLRGKPTYGDKVADGKEEDLKFFTDEVYIDQMRHPVSAGGKMTRKRTAHNLRTVAKERLSDYWSKFIDEMHFIYLSGARGINEDFTESVDWQGHAGNPIQAPDAGHILYAGAATSKATVTNTDTMSRETVERAQVKARMMRAQDPTTANMLPVKINGEDHYCMVMSPFDEHNLRVKDEKGWLEIQKAAAAAEGRNNPLFKGSLGMINNTVLHSHESVIRFADYGASGNLPASRSLFMGRQAGVVAYGTEGGLRFSWKEESKDYGNQQNVIAGTIIGIKKTRFNGKDFGVMAVDSYSKDPNA
ncbi:N4-gp56 family major capsid protein [Bradyrhizobium elkanii]|uniref:N4-gp56 family major capsid protein n=1 Tax=Bradyrhizobium elkanii TaxID=29448 RepID=UPI0035144A66